MTLTHRIAVPADLPELTALMDRAMAALLSPFLGATQVAASRAIMGFDAQLVADGTYFMVFDGGVLAGCGGWSKRATAYGGDHSRGRDARLLDAATEPTRIRAMYTDPAFVRRGIGRHVLDLCEAAARNHGFSSATLVATMAGLPLYKVCGYTVIERFEDASGGAAVPLARMMKPLSTPASLG